MALRARFNMVQAKFPMLGQGGIAAKDWYVFFYNLYNAVTEGLPQEGVALDLTSSPFPYQAVIRGQAHIGGGTVSLVEFSRNGRDWYDTGITAGFVEMDARDLLRVTYSAPPVITYFPM